MTPLWEDCIAMDVKLDIEWIQTTLTVMIDSYTTSQRVVTHLKRWWTPEMTENGKKYGRKQGPFQQGSVSEFTLKAEHNPYHYTVQRAKHQFWAALLHGTNEIMGHIE